MRPTMALNHKIRPHGPRVDVDGLTLAVERERGIDPLIVLGGSVTKGDFGKRNPVEADHRDRPIEAIGTSAARPAAPRPRSTERYTFCESDRSPCREWSRG